MTIKAIKTSASTLAATALAVLGLANVSPVQLAGTGAVLGFGMMATPALAALNIPGVGIVVKKKPGNAPIIAPSDKNGALALTGLEPGEYQVGMIGEDKITTVAVGADGVLAVQGVAEDDGSNRHVEPIKGSSVIVALLALSINVRQTISSTPPAPCARPSPGRANACRGATMNYIDVNASSAADIMRLAPTTSAEAAQFFVAERARGGAFIDPIDFAQRTCPKVSVDFGFAPSRIGNALIVARGSGSPKSPGFKCAAQGAETKPVLELYGVSYSYVGHVTLLR